MSSLPASHFWQSAANLLVVRPGDGFFAVEHPLHPHGAVGEPNGHRHFVEMLRSWGRGLRSQLRAGPLANEVLIP